MDGEPLTVGRILELAERRTLRQRLTERLEEARVWWFLRDAQEKQAIVLAVLYLGYTLLDLCGALVKTRIGGNQHE